MSWESVDDKHKKWRDRDFVSCTEAYEVDYIVKLVREEYPSISESTIRQAIAACCQSVGGNHPRKEFMACLKLRLGV